MHACRLALPSSCQPPSPSTAPIYPHTAMQTRGCAGKHSLPSIYTLPHTHRLPHAFAARACTAPTALTTPPSLARQSGSGNQGPRHSPVRCSGSRRHKQALLFLLQLGRKPWLCLHGQVLSRLSACRRGSSGPANTWVHTNGNGSLKPPPWIQACLAWAMLQQRECSTCIECSICSPGPRELHAKQPPCKCPKTQAATHLPACYCRHPTSSRKCPYMPDFPRCTCSTTTLVSNLEQHGLYSKCCVWLRSSSSNLTIKGLHLTALDANCTCGTRASHPHSGSRRCPPASTGRGGGT
jgi:hypothetical protein